MVYSSADGGERDDSINSANAAEGLVRLVVMLLESAMNANDHAAVSQWPPSRYFRFEDGHRGRLQTRMCWLYGVGRSLPQITNTANDIAEPLASRGTRQRQRGAAVSDRRGASYGLARRSEASITLPSAPKSPLELGEQKSKSASFPAPSPVEPAGIEPATSCLQRNPSGRVNWHDLLGISPSGPQRSWAKARFVCRHFAGRWSTEVPAWTSAAAAEPRVLLGATDAPRGGER